MCGIVGYIGKRQASSIVLSGLQALEYRGYDSAGIALIDKSNHQLIKQVGRVQGLIDSMPTTELKAGLAIGHTRWATHGSPTMINAHPHTNSAQTIFVVHNGIIENYLELKNKLITLGYIFVSETDTEVIPHLIDYYMQQSKNFETAFKLALSDLQGAYSIAAISLTDPDTLFAARLSSPLVIGVGKHEHILASDPTALIEHTQKVIYLDDYDFAVITADSVKIHNLKKDLPVQVKSELIDYTNDQARLGDYDSFMLKEMHEIPATIRSATLGRALPEKNIIKLGGLENVISQLHYIDRIVIVACGTSFYAGQVGEYLIEEIAGIPVEVEQASEFKYRHQPFSRSTALLAISQSGETADTIAALKKVEDYGVLKLGIVNTVGSTIARMTDAGVYCHAGPEQAVASTKAFIAQVSVLILIALHFNNSSSLFKPLLSELDLLPSKAQEILNNLDQIKKVAKKYAHYRDFIFIGRSYNYPCAMEGALKLKEISYIHAEGYSAGELKHGPIAMIDKDFPTMAIATDSPLLTKTYSNIEEIKARQGPVIAIASVGNKKIEQLTDDVIFIPKTMEQTEPILVTMVMQLFAYYAAVERGNNVDRPRNLAKSVTVE